MTAGPQPPRRPRTYLRRTGSPCTSTATTTGRVPCVSDPRQHSLRCPRAFTASEETAGAYGIAARTGRRTPASCTTATAGMSTGCASMRSSDGFPMSSSLGSRTLCEPTWLLETSSWALPRHLLPKWHPCCRRVNLGIRPKHQQTGYRQHVQHAQTYHPDVPPMHQRSSRVSTGPGSCMRAPASSSTSRRTVSSARYHFLTPAAWSSASMT